MCALKPSLKSSRQPMWRPGDQIQILGQGSRLEINLGCLLIVGETGAAGNNKENKSRALKPHNNVH